MSFFIHPEAASRIAADIRAQMIFFLDDMTHQFFDADGFSLSTGSTKLIPMLIDSRLSLKLAFDVS